MGLAISEGFPAILALDVNKAAAAMPLASLEPRTFFTVRVSDEDVTLPYRIYNPEPDQARLTALSETQRLVAHCIYTRHHDGFVRQAHLSQLLASHEPWVAPFVTQLIGEYVVQIIRDIWEAVGSNSAQHESLRHFLQGNPAFSALTHQRAISYWNEYYRGSYPTLSEYPGVAVLMTLGAA